MKHPFLPFIFHPNFTVKNRVKIPNWHKNIEILQCIDGEGFVRCDKTVFPLKKGSFVTVNSDVLHSIGSNGNLRYRCLIIDNEFFLSNGIPAESLLFLPFLDDPEAVDCFDRVCDAFLSLDPDDFLSVANIRCLVLHFCVLLSKHTAVKPPFEIESNYVKEAIVYIRQNLSKAITLESLSREIGISRFHLARQFKRYTGNTVIQTVKFMRCTEAMSLLERGVNVSEVADLCGFPNHSYFSKTFKSVFGKLPSEVMKKWN